LAEKSGLTATNRQQSSDGHRLQQQDSMSAASATASNFNASVNAGQIGDNNGGNQTYNSNILI
jgi:hypothetical protein